MLSDRDIALERILRDSEADDDGFPWDSGAVQDHRQILRGTCQLKLCA